MPFPNCNQRTRFHHVGFLYRFGAMSSTEYSSGADSQTTELLAFRAREQGVSGPGPQAYFCDIRSLLRSAASHSMLRSRSRVFWNVRSPLRSRSP